MNLASIVWMEWNSSEPKISHKIGTYPSKRTYFCKVLPKEARETPFKKITLEKVSLRPGLARGASLAEVNVFNQGLLNTDWLQCLC